MSIKRFKVPAHLLFKINNLCFLEWKSKEQEIMTKKNKIYFWATSWFPYMGTTWVTKYFQQKEILATSKSNFLKQKIGLFYVYKQLFVLLFLNKKTKLLVRLLEREGGVGV